METNETSVFFKTAREKKGLSQRKVAEVLGYKSPQYISNFERGFTIPSLKVAKKLCKMYGAPLREARKAYVADYALKLERAGL